VLPLGHAAFAYLCYVGYRVASGRPLPVHWALVPLVLGSQFPDLIDKPLAFYGLLPSGRTLAHSIFTAFATIAVIRFGVERFGRPESEPLARLYDIGPTAFAIGYLTHLAGDLVNPLLVGDPSKGRFLLWPVSRTVYYSETTASPVARVLSVYRDGSAYPQLELVVLAGVVFLFLEVRYRTRQRPRSASN